MKIKNILISFLTLILFIPGFSIEANTLNENESLTIEGYPLSLNEAIRLTLKNNFDIETSRLQRKINVRDVTAEYAIYDTELSADFGYTVDEKENTLTFLEDKENTTAWNLGLSKKLPFGTTLSLDLNSSRNSTKTPGKYYIASETISITHPLLNNSFGFADKSNIKIVKLDVSQLDLGILNKIEKNIADTINTYWELVFAHKNLHSKQEALSFAEHFLEITQKQVNNGALEETDLFAAQANVEIAKRGLLNAKTSLANTSDDLKLAMNFFKDLDFAPSEKLPEPENSLSREKALTNALENRRDLKQAHINSEKKDITINLKKNELLPQLDLIGTFTSNGLSRELADAMGESSGMDDPTYFIGLEITYPIENTKARSVVEQSQFEKAQAILQIAKTEKEIFVDISKAARNIDVIQKQCEHDRKTVELQKNKLNGEEKKYNFGRSSSDIIIRYEDDVINAKTQLFRTLTDYQKALVNLKLKENTLLDDIDWITYEEIK